MCISSSTSTHSPALVNATSLITPLTPTTYMHNTHVFNGDLYKLTKAMGWYILYSTDLIIYPYLKFLKCSEIILTYVAVSTGGIEYEIKRNYTLYTLIAIELYKYLPM